MTKQKKPHEQNVLLSAVERTFVGYFGLGGQIGTGIPVHERPAEPPVGAVYEQEYVLYQDIELEDGTVLKLQQLHPEEIVPKKFLRGRLITDKKEVMTRLVPPILREFASVLGVLTEIEECVSVAVVVKKDDCTEVVFPLQNDDVPPPKGASHYPVGESPEEQRMAEMVMEATLVDDEADELAEIRQDAKDGVYGD